MRNSTRSTPTPVVASRAARRRLRRRIALALSLPALLFVAAIIAIDIEGHRDYAQAANAPRADAIVILGARVMSNGAASSTLRERTMHAVDLWRKGRAPFLICTGGVGAFPPSEAEVTARLAQKHGVPRDKIVLENRSVNTRQNVAFAAEICRARGWKRVIVVSQPFHLPRAVRYFRQQGLIALPSPVPNSRIDGGPLSRLQWTAREILSTLRDWFV